MNTTKRFIVKAGAVAALLGGLAYVLEPHTPSPFHAAFGAAAVFAGVLPALMWDDLKRVSAVPLFPVVGLYYVVAFGLPAFLTDYMWSEDERIWFYTVILPDKGTAISSEALALAAASIALFVVSFYAFRMTLARRIPRLTLPGPMSALHLVLLAWGLIAVHCAYVFIPGINGMASVGQFARPAGFLGFALFVVLMRRGQVSVLHGFVVFGLVLTPILVRVVLEGSISQVMFYALVLFFAIWYARRRFPIVLVLTAFFFLIVSYNVVASYRKNTWAYVDPEIRKTDFIDRARLFTGLVVYSVTGHKVWIDKNTHISDTEPFTMATGWKVARRVAQVILLSRAMDLTPETVPYYFGKSYEPLLTSLIPRLILPDKPREVFGGEVGVAYWNNDRNTSVNVSWLLELFVNFGVAGVVVGMAFFGVLFAVLDRLLNSAGGTDAEAMVGMVVLQPFVYPDSNFSLLVGGLPLFVLAIYCYFFLGWRVLARYVPVTATGDSGNGNRDEYGR